MKWSLLLLAVLACGKDSVAPAGLDPTVLIRNQTSTDTVYFTWRDGQGIAGTVTVLPLGQSCTRFLARADSAYFEARSSRPGFTYTQPWFDPQARAAWTMTYQASQVGGGFLVRDEATEPC